MGRWHTTFKHLGLTDYHHVEKKPKMFQCKSHWLDLDDMVQVTQL